MRTIIAGSRKGVLPEHLFEALELVDWEISVVLCGEADGADTIGKVYAEIADIPLDSYPADWVSEPRKAGYIRNELMGRNADALILLWDGESRGSANMLRIAERRGLKKVVLFTK